MLDIRNVKVNFDRSVEPYSFDIGMQHENGIVRLDFEFDEKTRNILNNKMKRGKNMKLEINKKNHLVQLFENNGVLIIEGTWKEIELKLQELIYNK